jgi:hypothetical protein
MRLNLLPLRHNWRAPLFSLARSIPIVFFPACNQPTLVLLDLGDHRAFTAINFQSVNR